MNMKWYCDYWDKFNFKPLHPNTYYNKRVDFAKTSYILKISKESHASIITYKSNLDVLLKISYLDTDNKLINVEKFSSSKYSAQKYIFFLLEKNGYKKIGKKQLIIE